MAQESGPAALVRRPLLWLGCCFCAGVVLSRYVGDWLPAVLAAGGLFLLARSFWRARRVTMPAPGAFSRSGWLTRAGALPVLLGLGLLVGGGGGWRMDSCSARVESGRLVLTGQLQKSAYAECRLRLLQPPETALAHEEDGFWKAPARLEELAGRPVDVAVLVYGEGSRDLRRDDVLRGRVMIYANRPPAWPGAFSYADYLHGLELCGRVKLLPGKVSAAAGTGVSAASGANPGFTLERPEGFNAMRWLDELRAAGIRQDLRLLPGQSGAFVAAALYGYRDDLDQGTNDSFRYVGIGHILAISGMNVGMVVGLVWWVFARLTHDRRKLAGICLLVCISYMVISGGQVTAVRAGVIAVIYLAGFFVSRRSDFLNSLGASALLLVLYNPYTLFSLSFQLSFAAVIAISCLDREYRRALPAWFPMRHAERDTDAAGGERALAQRYGRNAAACEPEAAVCAGAPVRSGQEAAFGFWRWLAQSVWLLTLMSMTAFAGVWGLMAWAFPQISFSGLLVNIVVIPLMTFSLAGGLLLPFADLLPASLEMAAAWLLGLPTDAMLWIAKKGMWLPGGGVLVYQPPWWLLCGHYALGGLFLARNVLPSRGLWRWGRRTLWAAFALSAGALAWYCLGSEARPERSVVVLPGTSDSVVLFDGAGGVTVAGDLQHGGQDVLGYLRYRRVGHLDRLILLPTRKSAESLPPEAVVRLSNQLPVTAMIRLPWQADAADGQGGAARVGAVTRGAGARASQTVRGRAAAAWMRYPVPGVSVCSFDGERAQAWVLSAWEGRWGFGGWLWPEQCEALAREAGPHASALFLRVRGRKPYLPPSGLFCAGQGEIAGGVRREQYGVLEFLPAETGNRSVRGWDGQEWRLLGQ